MLDAWGIGVLSQSLARVSNTRFLFAEVAGQPAHSFKRVKVREGGRRREPGQGTNSKPPALSQR
jgi:hypothetical protein